MSFPPPSSQTHTDLTLYYYSTNCSGLLNKLDQTIRCNKKLDIEECCKYFIHKIYNVSYNLDKCYYVNDTFIEFKCNEEKVKDFLTSLLIAFIMSMCMCFCITIYEMKKSDFFNCKQNTNNDDNINLMTQNNPTYRT